jgi:hypothetical protein
LYGNVWAVALWTVRPPDMRITMSTTHRAAKQVLQLASQSAWLNYKNLAT